MGSVSPRNRWSFPAKTAKSSSNPTINKDLFPCLRILDIRIRKKLGDPFLVMLRTRNCQRAFWRKLEEGRKFSNSRFSRRLVRIRCFMGLNLTQKKRIDLKCFPVETKVETASQLYSFLWRLVNHRHKVIKSRTKACNNFINSKLFPIKYHRNRF